LKLKGTVLANQKNFESSLDTFNSALKINAKDASVWRMKSLVLYDLAKHTEALKAADRTIELNPNDYLAWEVKGRCHYYRGQYLKSLEAFKHATPQLPANLFQGSSTNDINNEKSSSKGGKPRLLNKIIPQGPKSWTIAIRESDADPAIKVTKIISLSDGGFSILTPYHNTQAGYLFKMPIDPKNVMAGSFVTPWGTLNGYTVNSRAKLSYHWDGFAQFSSEKKGEIISGRDPKTKEPKGLGIMTRPLSQPIWSGGSVGITLWGLNDFESLDSSKDTLVFDKRHFYYRGCSPDEANGYHLAIYVFPNGVIPPCRYEDGHLWLDIALEPLNIPLISVTKLSILTLPEKGLLLGLLVNRIVVKFPHSSGWQINGPGDYSLDKNGYNLQAFYPIPLGMPLDKSKKLDYKKDYS
jgi:tetratricopeptide (TPR) repeat protein